MCFVCEILCCKFHEHWSWNCFTKVDVPSSDVPVLVCQVGDFSVSNIDQGDMIQVRK